ncbi:MAG: TrkH family potassium uptake protein [Bacteroidales bacterium]|nr:TrkH family potassium uptake protein [Bacteroidales bacterium]
MIHFYTRIFNGRLVARLLGFMLLTMAVFMLIPIGVSLYYGDGALKGFLVSVAVLVVMGVFFRSIVGRSASYEFHEKESFWITGVIWIVVPLVCALPYWLIGVLPNFIDAVFESFSGFTSTGSTVVQEFDSVPKSVLVWRSLTQWIGGMGFILLVIAFFKKLKAGTSHLYSAEFSGTVQNKIHPRMTNTVRRMWLVYLLFTILMFLVLLFVGNDFVESLCLSFSTISTGGFSPRAGSITSFEWSTQLVVTVFMFLSGINMSLLYYLLRRKPKMLWRSEEFRFYLLVIAVAVLLLTIMLITNGVAEWQSLQYSVFQVVSTISTGGYYIAMPGGWMKVIPLFLFVLMFFGACSGSTGGGIKMVRLMILFKYVRNQFLTMMHPRAVVPVKIDGNVIQLSYINKIFAFIFMYFVFMVAGAFVLMCCGLNLSDSMGVITANIANIGPVIDTLGAAWSYADLPAVAKIVIIVEMLIGRLEIFAIIAIFSPSYWRR